MKTYQEVYNESIEQPALFWAKQAEKITWFNQPNQPFKLKANGTAHWFEGGTLNTSYLCLDVHVNNGFGDNIALIYDSPVTNTIRKYRATPGSNVLRLTAHAWSMSCVQLLGCSSTGKPRYTVPVAASASLASAQIN